MNLRKLNLLLFVILAVSPSFGENKRQESKALVEHALQLSNIRTKGAPAFRLKTTFKVMKDDSIVTEGTYTETWVSSDKWRRETVAGDFRRIEVSNGTEYSNMDNISGVPEGVGETGFRIDPLVFSAEYWKIRRIEDRTIDSLAVRCIQAKVGGNAELCFSQTSGVLVTKGFAASKPSVRAVDSTCAYRDYQEFSGRLFPRVIQCSANHKPMFEETVVELSPEPSPDSALFAPPPKGQGAEHCQGITKPPKLVRSPDPHPVDQRLSPQGKVVLTVNVGIDGVPRELSLVHSAGKPFDEAAIESVRDWRFKPATCNGSPVSVNINIEVDFGGYR